MFGKTAKLVAAAFALTAISPANAQEKTHNHTLGSGEEVWRIELRTLEHFLTMSVGDGDGTSELRYIDIQLSGPGGQFHKVREVNPFLQVNDGPRSLRNTIDVRLGDRVSLDRLDPPELIDTYDLWIHAQPSRRPGSDTRMLNFQITVSARELDCVRDRVCNRGSTGTLVYDVSVPIPRWRSNRCSAQNTYQISAVNGAQMNLQPRNARAPRGQIEVNSRARDSQSGRTIATGGEDAVRLAMQGGQICIASTTR